jgi:hypothetical protein
MLASQNHGNLQEFICWQGIGICRNNIKFSVSFAALL